MNPDPHFSKYSEALEAQNKAVDGRCRSQLRPGGSLDQWLKIPITLMRSRIWIRVEMKNWIRIRIKVREKDWIRVRIKVMRIRNPSS